MDTGALGSLRVGLLDTEGKAVEGFGVDDCDVLRINSTHAVVSWRGAADLSALKSREIQVSLVGSRARVFSFFFQP